MLRSILLGTVVAIAALIAAGMSLQTQDMEKMPFGGKDDVAFADKLWDAMKGYQDWHMASDFYPGGSPHGEVLRMYYSVVSVDDKPYHVIVKENYAGEDATVENVRKAPHKYLGAVTVMLQREAGYDADNGNWFWVKYKADGETDKNPAGVALAGRVAKGMDTGCIACHVHAKGNDYIFFNDE